MIEVKILEILKKEPYLSNREIGKIIGLSRSSIQYYMNKLNIHRDRKELQKRNNTSRKKELYITPNAEQLILGSILGDGYISPNRHPINTRLTLNSELIIHHGIKQKDYIEYKRCLLEKEGIRCHLHYLNSSSRKVHYIKGIEVRENGMYTLKTTRNVSFNFYRNLFYRPNKKVGRYIYKLKALGLAIWFMDDGYKHGNGFVLCTNCFTYKEVLFLQKVIKHNFDLDTSIFKSNLGHPLLYIKTSCREKFLKIISPYICESMKYKIGV